MYQVLMSIKEGGVLSTKQLNSQYNMWEHFLKGSIQKLLNNNNGCWKPDWDPIFLVNLQTTT